MILLSISPFIFIQCGSGGPVVGRGEHKGEGAPRRAAGGGWGFCISIPRFHPGKAHRGSAVRPFRSI